MSTPGDVELAEHHWRQGTAGCLCDYRYGSYGRLYGISMGEGWIRTNTHPDCPHHREGRQA